MALLTDTEQERKTVHSPVLLQAKSLSKRYGDQRALSEVSFDVRAGELLGLIGPNGAGKTTLLEAVAGLLALDEGNIVWCGAPVSISSRHHEIFFLPDGLRPWDEQYVSRVLDFFAGAYRRTREEVDDAVSVVGLEPALGKRVSALSKGFARRLMLALGLLTPQAVLLMDEPFDGFDLRQTREVMTLLRRVAGEGRTLVLAIHQLADAERVCDRFVLLAAGAVRGIGTLDELRRQAQLPSAGLEELFLALT